MTRPIHVHITPVVAASVQLVLGLDQLGIRVPRRRRRTPIWFAPAIALRAAAA